MIFTGSNHAESADGLLSLNIFGISSPARASTSTWIAVMPIATRTSRHQPETSAFELRSSPVTHANELRSDAHGTRRIRQGQSPINQVRDCFEAQARCCAAINHPFDLTHRAGTIGAVWADTLDRSPNRPSGLRQGMGGLPQSARAMNHCGGHRFRIQLR
jgi:hypothetical protein